MVNIPLLLMPGFSSEHWNKGVVMCSCHTGNKNCLRTAFIDSILSPKLPVFDILGAY